MKNKYKIKLVRFRNWGDGRWNDSPPPYSHIAGVNETICGEPMDGDADGQIYFVNDELDCPHCIAIVEFVRRFLQDEEMTKAQFNKLAARLAK